MPGILGGVTQWGLEAIFNPGKRFDDDERRRLQATREEVGDASGGKRIDLMGGKVVISPRSTDGADEAAAPVKATPSPHATHRSASTKKSTPTPSAERAAAAKARRAAAGAPSASSKIDTSVELKSTAEAEPAPKQEASGGRRGRRSRQS